MSGEVSAKKRRTARTQEKEERLLRIGLEAVVDEQDEEQVAYVVEQIKGPKRHLARTVAHLLRRGTLEQLARGEMEQEFDDSVVRFRNLRLKHLMEILVTLEPGLKDREDELQTVGRATLLKWTLFGLSVKDTHFLPNEPPPLRQVSTFAKYCLARYNSLGRRLHMLTRIPENDLKESSIPGHFRLDFDNKLIACTTTTYSDNGLVSFPFGYFDSATDWEIVRPFSIDAFLRSQSSDMTFKLAPRMKKSCNVELDAETANWDIPADQMVAILTGKGSSSGSVVSSGSGGTARPAPPAGTGSVVAAAPNTIAPGMSAAGTAEG